METSTPVFRVVSPCSRTLWPSLLSLRLPTSSHTKEATITICSDPWEQGSVNRHTTTQPTGKEHLPWLGDHQAPDRWKYSPWSPCESTETCRLHKGSFWQLSRTGTDFWMPAVWGCEPPACGGRQEGSPSPCLCGPRQRWLPRSTFPHGKAATRSREWGHTMAPHPGSDSQTSHDMLPPPRQANTRSPLKLSQLEVIRHSLQHRVLIWGNHIFLQNSLYLERSKVAAFPICTAKANIPGISCLHSDKLGSWPLSPYLYKLWRNVLLFHAREGRSWRMPLCQDVPRQWQEPPAPPCSPSAPASRTAGMPQTFKWASWSLQYTHQLSETPLV